MTTRSAAPFAGIDWLKNAVGLIAKRPGTLMGAAAWMLLVAFAPTAITLPLQLQNPGSMTILVISFGISLAASLLMAPMMGGYVKLIDSIERGEAAGASDVFGPFRQGTALRLIGFALLFMVVFFLAIAAVVVVFSGSIFQWYTASLANPAAHLAPPSGFWVVMAVIMVAALLSMGVTSLGYGQVAIGGRGALAALGDGAMGTIKNVVPLFVLFIASIVVGVCACIVMGVVVALLSVLSLFGSQSAWGLVVVIPLYIALMLVMYPIMFGVMYHFWRDVCGQDRPNAMAQTLA